VHGCMTTAISHRRRWLPALAIMVGVSALLIWRGYARHVRAQDLAHEIQLKGGQVYADTTLMELVQRWWAGYPVNWKAGRMVTLFDVRMDSAWLREHDDLADLQIAYLYFGRSTVTTEDAVRIIDRNPLQTYSARGQQDADAIAAALTDKSGLTIVELPDSDLTDDGLKRLPLEQLEGLFVERTRVTPTGLAGLRRCKRLTEISIDGHQIDESVVATLVALPTLERVSLYGPSITDDNIQLIAPLQKLPYLHLRRTTVTTTATETLDAAMPATVIGRE